MRMTVHPLVVAWTPTAMLLTTVALCGVIYWGDVRRRAVWRRLMVGLIVAALGGAALAAGDIVLPDICWSLEPYSAGWWLHGCFLPW